MAKKFNLIDFAVWVEKQPPDKEYNYCDSLSCAAAQFTGREWPVGL